MQIIIQRFWTGLGQDAENSKYFVYDPFVYDNARPNVLQPHEGGSSFFFDSCQVFD